MIARDLALRIFGLSERADDVEVADAYRALRAHVEARLAADPASADARRAELRDLERARRAISAVPVPPGRDAGPPGLRARSPSVGTPVARWVLAWAVLATLCAAVALVALLAAHGSLAPRVLAGGGGSEEGQGGGFAIDGAEAAAPSEETGGGADAEDAGPRARLVARSRVEGAALLVSTRGEPPEIVARGAADETEYWLSPGEYALRVAHPDCSDAWERELDARGGDQYEFAPEICKGTGWVAVKPNVDGSELSIDGKKVGATPGANLALAAGEHEIRVAKPGYEAWEGVLKVEPGEVLGMRPRLARARPAPPRPSAAARTPGEDSEPVDAPIWHVKAKQWLIALYDEDRSGLLDSEAELSQIPCDQWLSLEQSHDRSGLGLSLTRFYGFDGNGWKRGALGVADEVRDIAYAKMRACGLR